MLLSVFLYRLLIVINEIFLFKKSFTMIQISVAAESYVLNDNV